MSDDSRTLVRPYKDEDNDAMKTMEKVCMQGDPQEFSWYAVFDDFTKRAKKYESYSILVLEDLDKGTAIGTASVGIKTVNWIDGQRGRVGHAFNLRLHPIYRGKGMAKPLVEERKRIARQAGCSHLYATIARTNIPSLKLFRPCATFDIYCFATNLGDITRADSERNAQQQPKDITFQCLSPSQGNAVITKYHGTKLFFPEDLLEVLQHPHCLGTWLAEDETTQSSAVFALWDSSATFKWQMTQMGVVLPLQSVANIFGLHMTGPTGDACLEALLHHVKTHALPNHQRIHAFMAPDDMARKIKASSSFLTLISSSITLCISPTEGNPTDDKRFEGVSAEIIFCDPRDY
jgi:GNAT superfamily N-acetyltransferase